MIWTGAQLDIVRRLHAAIISPARATRPAIIRRPSLGVARLLTSTQRAGARRRTHYRPIRALGAPRDQAERQTPEPGDSRAPTRGSRADLVCGTAAGCC